ncbi:MAG: hypothetical protein AAF236_11515 [Verrucomicrobiota bacterium]
MADSQTFDAAIKALKMMRKVRRLSGLIFVNEGVLLHAESKFTEEQEASFVREVNALIALYRNSDKQLSRSILGFDGGNVLLYNCVPFWLALFFDDKATAETVQRNAQDFFSKWADPLGIDPSFGTSLPKLSLDGLSEVEPASNESPTSELAESAAATTAPIRPASSAAIQAALADQSDAESIPASDLAAESRAPSQTESEVSAQEETPTGPAPGSDQPTRSMDGNAQETWNSFRSQVEGLFSKVLGRAQASRIIDRELKALGIASDGFLNESQFRPFGQKLVGRVKDRMTKKQLETELVDIVNRHIGS